MTIYNFSAGPATLPKPVLEKAQAELLNYQESGMSVLEMSHRSPEFDKIVDRCSFNGIVRCQVNISSFWINCCWVKAWDVIVNSFF